jgi:alginate O-acetyltransferase complex protein AlgJ
VARSAAADPRQALVEFKRQLEQRGIALVVVPTPVKPAMHPEKLASGRTWTVPVQNPSYRAFLEDLRSQQRESVRRRRRARARQRRFHGYLATDTHWRPEAMERAAVLLGQFIRDQVSLADAPSEQYQVEPREITNVGDVATMLDLPEGHRLNRPESVTIHRVLDADGQPWRPSRSADVLVLGDSFSNIYSLARSDGATRPASSNTSPGFWIVPSTASSRTTMARMRRGSGCARTWRPDPIGCATSE